MTFKAQMIEDAKNVIINESSEFKEFIQGGSLQGGDY